MLWKLAAWMNSLPISIHILYTFHITSEFAIFPYIFYVWLAITSDIAIVTIGLSFNPNIIFSRPRQIQGLLYKHCLFWFIHYCHLVILFLHWLYSANMTNQFETVTLVIKYAMVHRTFCYYFLISLVETLKCCWCKKKIKKTLGITLLK